MADESPFRPVVPPGLQAAVIWLGQIQAATGREPDAAAIERVTADCHRNRPCGDCGVELGQPHDHGCDVERCMWAGAQWIACGGTSDWLACDCEEDEGYDEDGDTVHVCGQVRHDCGSQVWDGLWPGCDVAIENGFYIYFDTGWQECGPEHPSAGPDLTCWRQLADWDRERGRWVLDPKHAAHLRARRLLERPDVR